MDTRELKKAAADVRIGVIKALHNAGSGHPGGSLSATDIVTALYFDEMNIDPKDPGLKGRDKCVFSKGHAGPAQLSAMALKGYFSMDEFTETLRKIGSKFQGHPNMKIPGIEMATGSLGQGFSAAAGMIECRNQRGFLYGKDHLVSSFFLCGFCVLFCADFFLGCSAWACSSCRTDSFFSGEDGADCSGAAIAFAVAGAGFSS